MGAKPKHPCAFCGRRATRLCDYQVSQRDREVITCDTPLCSQCTTTKCVLISLADTIDWCPTHGEPDQEFQPYPVDPVYVEDILQRQATSIIEWRENHAAAINQLKITEATHGR